MGEAIHCDIQIRHPATWCNDVDQPPWFVKMFYDDLYEWPDIDAYILNDTGEIGGWLMSGALNYGSNSEAAAAAMAIMRELGIPFIFTEEGHPEWSGQLEIFTGTRSIERTITEDSNVVLDEGTWRQMRANNLFTAGGTVLLDSVKLARAVDEWWAEAKIGVDDLTVDHLPMFCPPEPESMLLVDAGDMIKGIFQ